MGPRTAVNMSCGQRLESYCGGVSVIEGGKGANRECRCRKKEKVDVRRLKYFDFEHGARIFIKHRVSVK